MKRIISVSFLRELEHKVTIGSITQSRMVEMINERIDSYISIDSSKLIAIEPELLDALEGISDILSNHYGDDPEETALIDAYFIAIKKARP